MELSRWLIVPVVCLVQHPYILPVVDIYYSKDKKALLVVQPFVSGGSLKDRIHRADPTRAYRDKYRVDSAAPLPFEEIAKFGRQILEALAALRAKGVMCDHVSTGNVLVDEGNARIADFYLPLLAVDRDKTSRELTVPLEANVDIDLLLFGHVLYEMATGMELLGPSPDDGVLELLAPEIAEVLELLFFPSHDDLNQTEEEANHPAETKSDAQDGSETNPDQLKRKKSMSSSYVYLVDIERVLQCDLFATMRVPPIESVFSGFRLDSSMKATIKNSMRINASRSRAHLVHYNDMVALERARQRAERRVLEERDKQYLRAQQLTESKHPLSKSSSFSSKTTPGKRKSYRAGRFRPHSQRSLGMSNQSNGSSSTSSA